LVFPKPAASAAIPEGLWEDPYAIQCRDQSRAANRPSYAIDRLIDHFHTEYVSGRVLQEQSFPFEAHEEALRNMARESRFGRRIIATEMFDIQNEADHKTFWASTIESSEFPGVRYVWLAYPQPSQGTDEDRFARIVLNHLKDHIYVARSIFTSALTIGVAFPNRAATATSYFLVTFDGTKLDRRFSARSRGFAEGAGHISRPATANTSTHPLIGYGRFRRIAVTVMRIGARRARLVTHPRLSWRQPFRRS
jgi:hypothetical protein